MEDDKKPTQRPSFKTDYDELREHYQFIPSPPPLTQAPLREDEGEEPWQMRMVRTYHAKLYKEFALADLSRAPEHIGLRWRTEREVRNGRGVRSCGNLRCTRSLQEETDLTDHELNFEYVEQDVEKSALVKVRLCPECRLRLSRSTAS